MYKKFSAYKSKHSFIIFVALFLTAISGFWIGSCLGGAIVSEFSDSIQGLVNSQPSAVVTFVLLMLPFFFTLLLIRRNCLYFLLPLLLLESAMVSFSLKCVLISFPVAGWLINAFVLFPRLLGLAVYCCLWFWLCSGHRRNLKRILLSCFLALCLIFALDYIYVYPFTAMLFIHL
ncbi:MAG: hypothetical protein IJB02_01315 [Oscillospiraceae bacterium]|nr:hypothetical protein [Oscillospiraceae bacterium]